ncbi:MAG: hypothetical protein HY287_12440 [Planctomycetes bacterium]|nr:hypothetical protein [Planctomycetota bacterium]MBI3835130.1 hypothetical protein [Planctomycetota bacterium]
MLCAILLSVGSPMPPRVHHVPVQASGIGYPPRGLHGPQARLMAERAAQVLAVRNLSNRLGGGSTAYLPGFRVVSRSVRANGAVEVVVEASRPVMPYRNR